MAGWVWAVFAPLLSLVTYTIVFSGAVKLPNNADAGSPIDYALFVFGGLVAFNFFAEMAYRAPSLLLEYAHYIKQTMFPAQMLPVISTLRATTYASIGLALMLLCQLVFSGSLHWTVLLLPMWFIPFLAFLLGLTWLMSAMGAFTRDWLSMMTISRSDVRIICSSRRSAGHQAAHVCEYPHRFHRDHTGSRGLRADSQHARRRLDRVPVVDDVLVRLLVLPPAAGRHRRCHLRPTW
jgi:hypothetical protein